jgi:adapter protein MecA 1/2
MKYENVNDNTIRITLTFEDLKNHNVKMTDFLTNQNAVEELFYELVTELNLEQRFEGVGMMSFQVRPHRKGVDLLVREEKVDMDNLEDMLDAEDGLEQFFNQVTEKARNEFQEFDHADGNSVEDGMTASEEGSKLPDMLMFTIKFDHLSDVVDLADNLLIMPKASELYRFKGAYYLAVLLDMQRISPEHGLVERARYLEYGQESLLQRELLHDQGQLVMADNALATINVTLANQ